MANPTPSTRVAPPDGAGNPIPERFLLGLAQKKPAPLAPARAKGPPQPTTRKGRLRVSIAGREGRPHPRGWLVVCLPPRLGRPPQRAGMRPLSRPLTRGRWPGPRSRTLPLLGEREIFSICLSAFSALTLRKIAPEKGSRYHRAAPHGWRESGLPSAGREGAENSRLSFWLHFRRGGVCKDSPFCPFAG